MIKYVKIVLAFYFMFYTSTYSYYCAMDCENLKVLQEEDMNHIQSVASISKVMTALIVLEHSSIREMVLINEKMIDSEGSSIYLRENELYSVETLLYGLMLRSGNDAALALALYCSNDDLSLFIQWMNEKAKQLGMNHTLFENPSGLEKPIGNQSSAYDMALLMCYASKNEILMLIMKANSYSTNNHLIWYNKNRLLKLNDTVLGGKTGFTHNAGRTLLSVAANPNRISIATFRVSNDFDFHNKLYKELFHKYEMIKLFSKGVYFIKGKTFIVKEDGYIPKKDFYENKVKFNVTSSSISLQYDSYIWHFLIIEDVKS